MESGINAGSRDRNGNVPNVNWNDKLYVNNYGLDNANDNLRARQAVS